MRITALILYPNETRPHEWFVRESIQSLLPIVDEFQVLHPEFLSEEFQTLGRDINDSRLHMKPYNASPDNHLAILNEQLRTLEGDWFITLEPGEIVHEHDLVGLYRCLEAQKDNDSPRALAFSRHQFTTFWSVDAEAEALRHRRIFNKVSLKTYALSELIHNTGLEIQTTPVTLYDYSQLFDVTEAKVKKQDLKFQGEHPAYMRERLTFPPAAASPSLLAKLQKSLRKLFRQDRR